MLLLLPTGRWGVGLSSNVTAIRSSFRGHVCSVFGAGLEWPSVLPKSMPLGRSAPRAPRTPAAVEPGTGLLTGGTRQRELNFSSIRWVSLACDG